MYESPIDLLMSNIQTQIIEQQEEAIYKAVFDIGVNVTKDELLRALAYDRQQYEIGFAEGIAAAKPEWISVKDRLPDKDGRYIVTACDEGCSCGDGIWYDTVVIEAEHYKGEWSWNENGTEYDITDFVTHWQPMPQPPKGE